MAGETPNASEQRADGWQHDTAERNRTVAALAHQLQAEQATSARLARELVEARAEVTRWRSAVQAGGRPTLEGMLREFHAKLTVHEGWMPRWPTTDIPPSVQRSREHLLDEELDELADAIGARSLTKIADGIADVIYVLAGTAVVHGFPLDALLAEVHRSNMTKTNVPGEPKLVKGPGYEPPDIARVLREASGG